jgi:hypothetical protein
MVPLPFPIKNTLAYLEQAATTSKATTALKHHQHYNCNLEIKVKAFASIYFVTVTLGTQSEL